MFDVDQPDFRVSLPDGDWTNQSTPANYDFRLGELEQFLAVVHLPHVPVNASALQNAVFDLARVRLDTIQTHSGNSCRFEPPDVVQKSDRFDAFIAAHDLSQNILMQIGFCGRRNKIVVFTYYDYSGSRNLTEFRERAQIALKSFQVQ